MNNRVPCFKNKNIPNGNSAKRVCRESIASTSWAKKSFDDTIMEDDFDFDKEDLQNLLLLESQYVNDKSKSVLPTANEKTHNTVRSFTPSKSTFSKSSSDFPDFSDLMSEKITNQAKSSNCIQFKNSDLNSPQVTRVASIGNINTVNNATVTNLNLKLAKLDEELLVKQGEVTNLRSELKRKEDTLEAERIERCLAIDEAECKGRQKGEKALAEMELKMKKVKIELEKTQSDVLFKNREIEELTVKQRKMQHQSNVKNSPVTAGHRDNRMSLSQKQNNFSANFDFGSKKPAMKNAEVQTCFNEVERKKRIFLKLKSSSKEFCIPQDYLCTNQFSLRANSKDTDASWEVVQNSATFATKSLEKLRIQCTSKDHDVNPWCSAGTTVKKWYNEKSIVHLRFLIRLKSIGGGDVESSCLEEVLKHMLPLSHENQIINADNQAVVIETLSTLISSSSSIPSAVISNILDVTKTFLSSTQSNDNLLAILSLFIMFASCEEIKKRMCHNDESCVLLKFFNRLEDISDWGQSLSRVCEHFVKLISELLKDPPDWLTNVECMCSTVLFNNVALYLHSQTKSLSDKSEIWPLLISYVRVVYGWATINPSWWEANQSHPACRVFLNNIWEQICGPSNNVDQHSTTILKQLL